MEKQMKNTGSWELGWAVEKLAKMFFGSPMREKVFQQTHGKQKQAEKNGERKKKSLIYAFCRQHILNFHILCSSRRARRKAKLDTHFVVENVEKIQ